MASIKEIAKGRSDLYQVALADLHVKDGWNGREENHPDNIAHIDALAQSIAAEGVKEALTAYMEDDKLWIENGHMRRAGALRAIEIYAAPADMTVPVRISPKDGTDADRILSQIIRNSGKALSPLEMAGVFERLNNLGLADAEIGRRTGLSRVYVGQLVQLAHMPKGVTDPVRAGTVSATLAIQTMKNFNGDGKKTANALKDAVAFAKSKGKVKATAKHVKKDAEGAADKPKKTGKKAAAEGEEGEGREVRKSSVTVMAEVRTIIETATTTIHEIDEGGAKIVMIAIAPAEYAALVKLLDLTATFPGDEVALDESGGAEEEGGDEENADADIV